MTKCILLFALTVIMPGLLPAKAMCSPFIKLPPLSQATRYEFKSANILNINASVSNKKVILDWQVDQNETADQFLVEKSTDGINYKIAALVFSTEKKDKEYYLFSEKRGKGKNFYRVLLISKNKKNTYSPVVEVNL